MQKFLPEHFQKKQIFTHDHKPIPVGNIFCIGCNYAKHIKELKSQDLGEPVIFGKPTTAVAQLVNTVELPAYSQEVHHEVELAIIISQKGKAIPQAEAGNYIAGAGVALDLTCRDLQVKAKKEGTPWTIAKGFDLSSPISKIYPINNLTKLANTELFLEKNGALLQQGNTKMMLYPLPFLISYLSERFTLNPGDIILTGTPEGVGPVKPGDKLVFGADFTEKVSIEFK